MATLIRPELSVKNKYWIDKHRHYELKHFCLQYPMWKKIHKDLSDVKPSISTFEKIQSGNSHSDLTAKCAMRKAFYSERITMIENIAREADGFLYRYILKAVTEGLSYTYLKSQLGIPCGRDMFYDRYRRFFWLLSEARQ